jgi:hypothetical protein
LVSGRPSTRWQRSATATGSGAPPQAQRAEIARPKVGMIEQRNPHGRNAEKRGGTFDLNVVQHCLDVEA